MENRSGIPVQAFAGKLLPWEAAHLLPLWETWGLHRVGSKDWDLHHTGSCFYRDLAVGLIGLAVTVLEILNKF